MTKHVSSASVSHRVACLWAAFLVLALGSQGCAAAPSPLTPLWVGSIGAPSCGVLAGGCQVRPQAPGLKWLRRNDRHWALPRFVGALERAASRVARERPGALLSVGDLSSPGGGGPALPHFSHRSGVDADLLFYVSSLGGASVESPGFVHFGADGLAQDPDHHQWLRLDVEREWLLVKTLIEDPQARIQWIFVSDVVKAQLIAWAMARDDFQETIFRAQTVMVQPSPGGVHDDHIHVRTACSPDEMVAGCEQRGPRRAWLDYDTMRPDDRNADLAAALFEPPGSSVSDALSGL